jgi:asparagine synthase (glutamine-hydrolysing)
VTYGLPQSRDVILAKRIAHRVGSDHHLFLQTDARWLLDKVDFHLQMTEGQTTFLHAHAAQTLEAAREWMDVNLTGFEGDQFLGARALDYTTPAASAGDDLTFRSRMYDHFTQDLCWPGLTDTEENSLYQPPLDRELRDRAYDSLGDELRRFQQFPLPRRIEFLLTLNHSMRLTHMNMVYQGAFMETRYPFCDYGIIDLTYSMPIDYRMHDKLYLAVINRLAPEVTWIPRASDGVILTARPPFRTMHRLMQKGKHRFNRHVWRLFSEQTAFHGDPETWFRQDWSEWAAGILFDNRTRDRGIFAPAALHSLFRRHMAGNELWTIGKIAPLITVEMAIRYLLDDAPYAQAARPAA